MKRTQLLLIAPALFLLGGLTSCNQGGATLTKISAIPTSTERKQNEFLKNGDITVTAIYSDNNNRKINYEYTNKDSYRISCNNQLINISGEGYKLEEVKDYTFDVTYSTYHASFTIKVTA